MGFSRRCKQKKSDEKWRLFYVHYSLEKGEEMLKDQTIYEKYAPGRELVYACAKSLDFLREIPDRSIRLVFTSPPYNIGKEYETKTTMGVYLSDQVKVIRELVRVLDDRGSLCWQVGNHVHNSVVSPLDMLYHPVFSDMGLRLKGRFVWTFGHGLHSKKRFSGRYEVVLWYTKGNEYINNLHSPTNDAPDIPFNLDPSIWDQIRSEWQTGVWNIPNVKSNHPEKTEHPCQFPVELAERCVLVLTKPGDVVLDPYAGVASTLIAAVKHGRRACGSEKEERYITIGSQRLRSFFEGKLKLRPLGKPIHIPSGKQVIKIQGIKPGA